MQVRDRAITLINEFDGEAAFLARNLTTGEEIGYREDAVMPTASTIKILVLAEVVRQAAAGIIALEDQLPMLPEDRRGGSGILKEISPDLMLSVRDHAVLMTALSDNTSTAVLVRLAGIDRIRESAREWGLVHTSPGFARPPDGDARQYAASTPRDLVHLLSDIAMDTLLAPSSCAIIRDILLTQQYHDQIGRYLPFHQYQREDGDVPHAVVVRSKSGFMTDPNGAVRVDAGIVETASGIRWVLCLMNEHNPDLGYGPEHPGAVLNGHISRLIYDTWTS